MGNVHQKGKDNKDYSKQSSSKRKSSFRRHSSVQENNKESKINKKINAEQAQAKKDEDQIHKLLLLGAAESGKSTLFKQVINLYVKDAYTEDVRAGYKDVVYKNTIVAMQSLIAETNRMSLESISEEVEIEEKVQDIADKFLELKPNTRITRPIADNIKALWKDKGIESAYERRAAFQFPTSGKYFITRVDEICEKDYIPTYKDVLRARMKTTQIREAEFDIFGKQFKILDVGGQRNQRRKWIHCFENVTSVIFVAAISEYDQFLAEDETTNRVHESLELFEEISNSKWFVATPIILFLNKTDLFKEKIEKVSLGVCFDDYEKSKYAKKNDYESACKFMKKQFELKVKDKDKNLYTHFTCATDTENMAKVFNNVKDIVLRNSLHGSALL